ncbi:MAG: DNA gyrase inhibitor YacG [Zetaproteobacteria bacterium CG12_big_fil_rev_8_21_14_0_65_55_1124]|nr:MAG: DNA gyrase inhibitor YacG [Zetaproteobacteria bacterium CG1_02_55_237]PIS20062.1 MAG: DNA gyrase inhibitor YacG [Zetaproteobacteria bacterium CG08_land_8_20_14_0_20_55_17]PIW42095.1 MAG: DNA gyrase inhibitor YacG [Zetaproteobacteria bacterium CG12_big_fil_rev_8_21_14_0_65_55_1124]PIY52917.1 MAG: DNA gyrase inhibitor YacG [Zetaproteobacteria bacterium CG_4_10_14_0_8_um_filter_55_43]PIZ39539.1 MAG: DNA gyrase inhibitor YacG [Zetaproteobacteria bacterium CG_4_10_14_0_2_um_filter_55_20]PJB
MTAGENRVAKCPVCRKPVEADSAFSPFCSKRCQVIDLGRWASGDYHIKGEPAAPWELEGGDEETGR